MTRFYDFTDEELDMMEETFCNEGLKYLVFEIRKEMESRNAESDGWMNDKLGGKANEN